MERMTGTVKWFNDEKGYDFIRVKGEPSDIYVHYSGINAEGFKTLQKEATVSFLLVKGSRGLEAKDVLVKAE